MSILLAYFLYAAFVFGCVISLTNFYISFLRYPIYRWRGGTEAEYWWASGIPLFGSLSLIVAMLLLPMPAWLWWCGGVSALLDTGGLHWMLGTLVYMTLTTSGRERN